MFQLGLYDAVANFNIGYSASIKVLEKLRVDPGYHTVIGCKELNVQRIKNTGRKESEKAKTHRRYLRRLQKSRGDKNKQKEKTTYSAGGF